MENLNLEGMSKAEIWELYLIACGVPEEEAAEIAERDFGDE